MFVIGGIGRGESSEEILELSRSERGDRCVESGLGIGFEGGKGSEEFFLGLLGVDAEEKVDERGGLSFAGAWDDGFGECVERGELLDGQKKWFGAFGGEMGIGGVEERAIQKMFVDGMSGGRERRENASGYAGENHLRGFATRNAARNRR